MAKLPFALKAGHPMAKHIDRRRENDPNGWSEVVKGVWATALPPKDFCKHSTIVMVTRDTGVSYGVTQHHKNLSNIAIAYARRLKEDQHEIEVARARQQIRIDARNERRKNRRLYG